MSPRSKKRTVRRSAKQRTKKTARVSIRPRFRVLYDGEIAVGPGKASLLHAVSEHGSIRLAAEKLGMSYMRAWSLIRTMNRCFRQPLVEAIRGGSRKGGAKLTPTGIKVLDLYERLEKRSLQVTRPLWKQISRLLK